MFAARFDRLYIRTYGDALAKFDSIKPVRGRADTDSRPLYRRNDSAKVIRKDSKGVIHLRYYSTDVLSYNPDNTIDITPYPSLSTAAFVRAALGYKVNPMWSRRGTSIPDHVTAVGGKIYHTPEFLTVKYNPETDDYAFLGGSVPFEIPQLDKTLTNEAVKESGFKQFALWLKTQIRLGLDPRCGDTWRRHPYGWSERDVSTYLTDVSGWSELVRRMSTRCNVDTELAALRLVVYRWYGCTDTVEVPWFDSYAEMASAFNRVRKYG